jgi:hypothetical protein
MADLEVAFRVRLLWLVSGFQMRLRWVHAIICDREDVAVLFATIAKDHKQVSCLPSGRAHESVEKVDQAYLGTGMEECVMDANP